MFGSNAIDKNAVIIGIAGKVFNFGSEPERPVITKQKMCVLGTRFEQCSPPPSLTPLSLLFVIIIIEIFNFSTFCFCFRSHADAFGKHPSAEWAAIQWESGIVCFGNEIINFERSRSVGRSACSALPLLVCNLFSLSTDTALGSRVEAECIENPKLVFQFEERFKPSISFIAFEPLKTIFGRFVLLSLSVFFRSAPLFVDSGRIVLLFVAI